MSAKESEGPPPATLGDSTGTDPFLWLLQTMTLTPWAAPTSHTMRRRRKAKGRSPHTSGPQRRPPCTWWGTAGYVPSCCGKSASGSGPSSWPSSRRTSSWWVATEDSLWTSRGLACVCVCVCACRHVCLCPSGFALRTEAQRTVLLRTELSYQSRI